MTKRLLAALALFCGLCAPALARSPWPDGVWHGSVGALPIQVCLQHDGADNLQGAYFYLDHLRPIALRANGNHVLEEAGGAIWTLRRTADGRVSGTWQGHERTLPLNLRRLPWHPRETWDTPCASREFIAPRLHPVAVTRRTPPAPTTLAYEELHYDVGQAFDSVDITSFALKESLPGDARINAAVALDPLERGSLADFAECMGGSLSSLGADGDFSLWLRPVAVRGDFLTVALSHGNFCGGAHPEAFTTYRTFDRRTGEELAIRGWLTASAQDPFDGTDNDGSLIAPSPALRSLVLSHFPRVKSDTEGCFDVVASSDFWNMALASGGLAFEPSLPHVANACGDTAIVPFAELGPFLSSAGQAGVQRITPPGPSTARP